MKRVNVGLSVQPIEDEMVEEIMVQGGSVSPIVTIEPRRRKFHKAITVSVPLPERISSAYLRKKQEINKNDRTIAPKKMPIGKSFLNFPIEKLKSTFKARVYLYVLVHKSVIEMICLFAWRKICVIFSIYSI